MSLFCTPVLEYVPHQTVMMKKIIDSFACQPAISFFHIGVQQTPSNYKGFLNKKKILVDLYIQTLNQFK